VVAHRSTRYQQTDWEHIAQLARLASDLRAHASFLQDQADAVEDMLAEAVDDDRTRDARREAVGPEDAA
jgi:hypothetical protein